MTPQNVKIRLRFTTSKPVLSNLSFIRPFEFTDQSDKQIFARTPYWFCESLEINSTNGQTHSQHHKTSVAIVRTYTFDLFNLFDSLIKICWRFFGKWSKPKVEKIDAKKKTARNRAETAKRRVKRSRCRLCDIFFIRKANAATITYRMNEPVWSWKESKI